MKAESGNLNDRTLFFFRFPIPADRLFGLALDQSIIDDHDKPNLEHHLPALA